MQARVDTAEQLVKTNLATIDSLKQALALRNADINQLGFELEQIEKYALFTDKELLAAYQKEQDKNTFLDNTLKRLISSYQLHSVLPSHRATSYFQDISCKFAEMKMENTLHLSKNIVLVDVGSILRKSNSEKEIWGRSMRILFGELTARTDWKASFVVEQNPTLTDYASYNFQQEFVQHITKTFDLEPNSVVSVIRNTDISVLHSDGIATPYATRTYIELEFMPS